MIIWVFLVDGHRAKSVIDKRPLTGDRLSLTESAYHRE